MKQLDQFSEELHEWSLRGKEPSIASRDLRYFLDLQEKRLKKNGTIREEEYGHVKEEIRGASFRKENGYSSKILYREAMQNITYLKDGKSVKKIHRPVTLYVSFVDKEENPEGEFVCPGCGSILTVRQAGDCCPYCGMFFETDGIYPNVSFYYTVPGIVERAGLMDRLKKEMRIAGFACGTLVGLLALISWNDMETIFRILASLFMGAFYGLVFAFLWYMLRSFILMLKLFREAGRSLPLMSSLGSRKKVMQFMKAYDPDFSYEEFEGRVLSLIRIIAFSDERESLSIYEGQEDLSGFDGLADMQYRGALRIKMIEKRGNLLRAEGVAYLSDTYVKKTVREKDEKIAFVLEKEADGHADPGFSIHKVSCLNCGGTFDAMHQRNCPYCSSPYDLKKKDWIIKEMRKI